MNYLVNKAEVMEFFDNHIMKYIITDLEILNKIKADDSGIGGCAIPQALSTFSALDLMGYLLHPQDIETNKMTFSDLLKNSKYFPEFETFSTKDNFILSFKDNLRNIIAHRFSLAKYDITKSDENHLFFEYKGQQTFNVSYLTKITINFIRRIRDEIYNDQLNINGYSKDITLEKIKNKISKLKNFEGKNCEHLNNLSISTVTTDTTSSLGKEKQ